MSEYDSFSSEGTARLHDAAINRIRKSSSRIGLSLFIYGAVTYLLVMGIDLAVKLLEIHIDTSTVWGITLYWFLSIAPQYLIAFPVFLLLMKNLPKRAPALSPCAPRTFILLFLFSRTLVWLGTTVSSLLTSFVGTLLGKTLNNTVSNLILASPAWLIVLIVCIVAPAVEEFIFRKAIMSATLPFGEVFCILFSAALFSLSHGNLYQVVYTFFIGAVLGFLYVKTGNVKLTFLFHALTNFLGSVAVLPVQAAFNRIAEALEGVSSYAELSEETVRALLPDCAVTSGYSILNFALVGAGVIVFVKYRKKITFQKQILPVTTGAEIGAAVGNAGMILFLLFTAFEFVRSVLI